MPTSRTLRQKAIAARKVAYADDRYVPLDCDRLRAAIAEHGQSLQAVADSVKATKQGLHHLVQRGQECRASLRRRLAKALGVPESYLAGDPLPAPAWLERAGRRRTADTLAVDENAFVSRAQAARYDLAVLRLATDILEAWRRDCDTGVREARVWWQRLSRGQASGEPPVRAALARLLSVARWRVTLLEVAPAMASDWDDALQVTARPDSRKPSREDADALAVAFAKAARTILRPWLEGTAVPLDYRALSRVLGWALRDLSLR